MNVCRLKGTLGELEPCPGGLCAFWSDGACAFEQLDLAGRSQLAKFLLGIRGDLEATRATEEASSARSLFLRRLNAGNSD
jgi:hypothetical protein